MPVTEYRKPWKSYREQLDQLISRGLTVTNHPKALECLQRGGCFDAADKAERGWP